MLEGSTGMGCISLNVFPPHLLELPENWTDTRETLLEGMVFQLKYLGVTMVEQPKGEELSAAAVKRIVATVRKGRGAARLSYSEIFSASSQTVLRLFSCSPSGVKASAWLPTLSLVRWVGGPGVG